MGTRSQPIISSLDGKTQFSPNVEQNWTVTDPTGKVVVQVGKLPNGTYGITMLNGTITMNNGTVNFLTINDLGITLNDGTDNRILLGNFPDGTFGIVVSKPGIDVSQVFL